jgi:uncharacterized repeat protein (TIGR01451 family)
MVFNKVRFLVYAVSLIVPVSVYGQQGKSFSYLLEGDQVTRYSVDQDHSFTIRYSVPGIEFTGLTNSQGDFYRIRIPGHGSVSNEGGPELPVFSKLIVIPENSHPQITISEIRSRTLSPTSFSQKGLLFPKQQDLTKNTKQRDQFIMNKELYKTKGLIQSDTVTIEYIGKLRGQQLAAIHISPVRYDPSLNRLEIITSMTVTVRFGSDGTKSAGTSTVMSSPAALQLSKGIINYFPDGFITGYSEKPVGLVILTDTTFKKILKPFITWKTQEGFRVTTIYKGTWPAGNSYSGIKDTLTSIYNAATEENPAPEYLLIVGDVNRIPSSDGTSQVSDLYYGEFTGGGDYIPELFTGRLPAADTSELKNILNKLLPYEKFQYPDTSRFYNRALVTAGDDGGYDVYMNGQVSYASSNYINTTNGFDPKIYNYPRSVSISDTIKKLFNAGLGFVNYTGHGDVSGWLGPSLKAADVPLLQNKGMYPFIITNACQTAHYNSAASLGNKMLVTADKGAIGYIGCSNDSYWDEDYYWSVGVGAISNNPKYAETGLGAYDRLFHLNGEKASDWFITMGQVNYAGNLSVSASTSTRKKYYWETYTLLGDPTQIPFIGKPDSFNIKIPDILPKGITSYSFIADPFSYIGVSLNDSLYDASYVSPDGSVTLNLPGNSDSCMIVATGQKKIPLIKKIVFGNVNDEFINLGASSVNDSLGNDNGKADFNESFWLSLKLENLGLVKADSVYAKLITNSTLLKILSDSVWIGSLNGRSGITLTRAMALKVADSVPDKSVIPVDLVVKDKKVLKRYRIDIMVHAPALEILSCYVDDTGVGNGNFIPEPGETVNLIFKVRNSGSSPASGTFLIDCPVTGVTIVPPGTKSGTIGSGETATYTMPLSFSQAMHLGELFTVSSSLSCTPYDKTKDFEFRIGKARENFEVRTFNIFPWINPSLKPWTITGTDAYNGLYSAKSGVITHNESTKLMMKVYYSVQDTLRFYCKVSSELNYDFLTFRINNNISFRISGETGWIRKTVTLPAGLNTLEWIYNKDEAVSAGSDCAFLDFIDFPDPTEIIYVQNDLSVDRVKSPVQNGDFMNDSVTVTVSNLGSVPLNGFNLAYTVNGTAIGYQHFDNILNNYLDSATVWFKQKPDLSKYDIYNIRVFGINNADDYSLNDTASIKIENIKIVEPFKAFPNPFSDGFRIIINTKAADEVTVLLVNSSGVIMKSLRYSLIEGENDLDIDCTGLPMGFYYLSVRGKVIRSSNSMIKVK